MQTCRQTVRLMDGWMDGLMVNKTETENITRNRKTKKCNETEGYRSGKLKEIKIVRRKQMFYLTMH